MSAPNLEKCQNKWMDDEDVDEELVPCASEFTKSPQRPSWSSGRLYAGKLLKYVKNKQIINIETSFLSAFIKSLHKSDVSHGFENGSKRSQNLEEASVQHQGRSSHALRHWFFLRLMFLLITFYLSQFITLKTSFAALSLLNSGSVKHWSRIRSNAPACAGLTATVGGNVGKVQPPCLSPGQNRTPTRTKISDQQIRMH